MADSSTDISERTEEAGDLHRFYKILEKAECSFVFVPGCNSVVSAAVGVGVNFTKTGIRSRLNHTACGQLKVVIVIG